MSKDAYTQNLGQVGNLAKIAMKMSKQKYIHKYNNNNNLRKKMSKVSKKVCMDTFRWVFSISVYYVNLRCLTR